MEKKNKGLIITIIVLVVCLLGTCGYIAYDKLIKKEEPKQEEKKEEEKKDEVPLTENDILREKYNSLMNEHFSLSELESKFDKSGTELALVKNEVSKFVAYLNYQIDVEEGTVCSLINYYFSFSDLKNGKNSLVELEPEIMECIFNEKYIVVDDNPWNGNAILTKSQYDKYGEYFSEVIELSKVDDKWVGYPTSDSEQNEYYEKIKPYLGQDYYYAYAIGDGYGSDGVYFEVENITKNGSKYEVSLNAYLEDIVDTISMMSRDILADDIKTTIVKYNAKLIVEVVNGHLKYDSFIIDK